MPDIQQKKDDFATSGQEMFNLNGVNENKKVVLNIQQESMGGIVLDKNKKRHVSTGNKFADWFESTNEFLVSHSAVRPKNKSNFYHLLGVMLNSGIPMITSLRSLYEQETNSRFRLVIGEIKENIEGGKKFSQAMLDYPDIFTEQEVGMVQAGEESGKVVQVLDMLAKSTEKSHVIKSKVKSAMMYPAAIFGLLIVVVIAMMVFVIPKLTDLFTSTGSQLPLITRVVVGISNFMINHGILASLLIVFMIFMLMIFKKTDTGKMAFDKAKINLPILGTLFKKVYLARFAMTLSNLLDSGISIVRAFEITANSVGNEVYRKRLMLAREDLKQGIPIAENLMSSDLFPPMLISMIDVGEKTAQLGEIMEKVSDFYEQEVDTSVEGLSKLLEPIILITIGITVGGVVAAIMLPIMQLSDVASKL